MAFITINYDGGNTYDDDGNVIENDIIYESVELHAGEEKFIFNSGNFPKDWYEAKKKYNLEIQDKEPYLSASSSVDHFIMDGAPYDSAYLHFVNDLPVFKYVDDTEPNYLNNQAYIFQEGWEFFVVEGTKPTWEEFKELVK